MTLIGEITECLDSKRVPLNSKERNERKGNIPYYGANGQVDSINDYLFEEELLLVAEDGGSWGSKEKCTYIIRGKSWVNNHAHVLRMKSNVLIKFLEAYLNMVDLTKYINGTTRGKLNQKQMNNIEIPLPTIPIQKHIVAILERAEKLKKKREQANEDTNTIIQSLFYEMFGDPVKNEKNWSLKTFVEIIKLRRGFDLPKNKRTKGKYPLITSNGITDHIDKFKVKGPGVVTGRSGTIGQVHYVTGDYWPLNTALYSEDMHGNNPLYLLYFLKIFRLEKFALGTGVSTLNRNLFHNITVYHPPISLQNKFASLVKKIESLKQKQSESTSDINNLFDALMQKAFNGELTN